MLCFYKWKFSQFNSRPVYRPTVKLYTVTWGKTGQKNFFGLANFLLYVNNILIKIYLKIILKGVIN